MVPPSERTAGLLYYRNPVKDIERPNILFSSDIPFKIATCLAELHLYQGGAASRVVDLSKFIKCFHITLELNALLSRNKALTPSELVRTNHIFVAKTKATAAMNRGITCSTNKFPDVWKSILSTKDTDEVFVVNFSLQLDQLTVDLANVNNIAISFHENKDFLTLLRCDKDLQIHLMLYIRHKLLSELKNNADISIHIQDSNTILQDSPQNECAEQFQSMSESSKNTSLDLADASLDESDISCVLEKQLILDGDDAFEASEDELRILNSDDSGKCISNEEEESDSAPYMPLCKNELNNILDAMENTKISTTNTWTLESVSTKHLEPRPQRLYSLFKKNGTRKHSGSSISGDEDDFISEIENLRHNDTSATGGPDHGEPSETMDSDPHSNEESDLTLKAEYEEFCKDISTSPIKCYDDESSPLVSPSKRSIHSTTSSKEDGPFLRKKASLSFIDHDDGYGLNYAYKDSSSSVPEYIKENKKFKFIKIGKVQKFVNMFEEQMDSPIKASSRVTASR